MIFICACFGCWLVFVFNLCSGLVWLFGLLGWFALLGDFSICGTCLFGLHLLAVGILIYVY